MSAGFEIRRVTNAEAKAHTKERGEPWQVIAYNLRELRKQEVLNAITRAKDINDMRLLLLHLVNDYGLLDRPNPNG